MLELYSGCGGVRECVCVCVYVCVCVVCVYYAILSVCVCVCLVAHTVALAKALMQHRFSNAKP